METITINKIIAEFMGYKYEKFIDLWDSPIQYYKIGDRQDKFLIATYTENWNTLIPVVEKVENLGYEVSIYGNSCTISLSEFASSNTHASTKIEAVCVAIAELIVKKNLTHD